MADVPDTTFTKDLPRESEAIVRAAKLRLWTHPDAGPGYERSHAVACADLIAAVRALNNAETTILQDKANGKR